MFIGNERFLVRVGWLCGLLGPMSKNVSYASHQARDQSRNGIIHKTLLSSSQKGSIPFFPALPKLKGLSGKDVSYKSSTDKGLLENKM